MKIVSTNSERGTSADLFISRYRWLSRWAMQFARNDRSAAEDLLQDTYLRFTQANLRTEDIRDPEALLYTYLEYVHLAHLRDVARHSFTSLAEAKLDELALGLPHGLDVDRIETQNTLRRVAAYLAWRKQTSKSASIVALRFFHGYLPEEIARIALMSRQAVDERLHQGRSEVRLNLVDSEGLRKLQHGGPAEIFPSKFAVSTDDLLEELHRELFFGRQESCLSAPQLVTLYRTTPQVPIPRNVLAHLVSCQSCLVLVEQKMGVGREPGGPGDGHSTKKGILAMKRRGPYSDRTALSANDFEQVVRRSERRQKEIFEHRPTALIVAVNGQILASRDTAGSLNRLKVEISARDLRFVEVLNEYGLSLLSWAVESTPPHSDPVAYRVADFSKGRRLEVDLQFSPQKVVIEVQYRDPSCSEILSCSVSTVDSTFDDDDEYQLVDSRSRGGIMPAAVRNQPTRWSWLKLTPSTATVFVCALILAFASARWAQRVRVVGPAEFVQRAILAERQGVQGADSDIILQRVSIRSRQGVAKNLIYSDPKGKHHMKQQPLDEPKQHFKMQLSRAGVNWDAPLSVSSFEEWEAHNPIRDKSVRPVGQNLLMLRVQLQGTDIEQETITVRATDFHPIGRTIQFRDSDRVEIAELNYAIVPWGAINQELFESDTSVARQAVIPVQAMTLPRRPLSDEAFYMAELQVETVLHESQADSTDRLTVSRTATGVQVSGLIEDEAQRSAIKHRLALIPHVSSNLSAADNTALPGKMVVSAPGVQAVAVVAEPSRLQGYLLAQGTTRDASNDVSDQLFAASTSLLRANNALTQLKEQFRNDQLSPDALELYRRLLLSWQHEIQVAVRTESDAIERAGVQRLPDGVGGSEPIDMAVDIEVNRGLVKELLGHEAASTRTVPMVMADLAHSVQLLRRGTTERNDHFHSKMSSNSTSARDNQR